MILEKFRREGIVNIAKINLDQHPSISTILDIKALPALFFFKDGILLNKNVEINEYTFVKNGVMAGITCETVLKEIINQI